MQDAAPRDGSGWASACDITFATLTGLPKHSGFTKNLQPEPWLCRFQGKPSTRPSLLLFLHLSSQTPLSQRQLELFPTFPPAPSGRYLKQKGPFLGHLIHPILALNPLHCCNLTTRPRAAGCNPASLHPPSPRGFVPLGDGETCSCTPTSLPFALDEPVVLWWVFQMLLRSLQYFPESK